MPKISLKMDQICAPKIGNPYVEPPDHPRWKRWNMGWVSPPPARSAHVGFFSCILYTLTMVDVSHEKNLALLSIESWLVNRDPYNL